MSKLKSDNNFAKWRWNEHMDRSVEEALSEIEREINVRTRCYDRWVTEGRVSLVDAHDRQERMLSAVKHLRDYQTHLKSLTDAADADITTSPGSVNSDRVIADAEFRERMQEVHRAAL